MSHNAHTGGCVCGAIRYTIAGEFGFSFLCHCRRCQRLTGTGHAAFFIVKRDAVNLAGDLSAYGARADSGSDVVHHFCGNCGSPIWGTTNRNPDIALIYAGSLDNPSDFKPTKAVFRDTAPPWDHTDPALEG